MFVLSDNIYHSHVSFPYHNLWNEHPLLVLEWFTSRLFLWKNNTEKKKKVVYCIVCVGCLRLF